MFTIVFVIANAHGVDKAAEYENVCFLLNQVNNLSKLRIFEKLLKCVKSWAAKFTAWSPCSTMTTSGRNEKQDQDFNTTK